VLNREFLHHFLDLIAHNTQQFFSHFTVAIFTVTTKPNKPLIYHNASQIIVVDRVRLASGRRVHVDRTPAATEEGAQTSQSCGPPLNVVRRPLSRWVSSPDSPGNPVLMSSCRPTTCLCGAPWSTTNPKRRRLPLHDMSDSRQLLTGPF
jgi:hypothetical protein